MSRIAPADIETLLARSGIPAQTMESVARIDALLQQWRRRSMKRELGHRALRDLHIPLDLPQFDVLMAIAAPETEFGALAAGETMVASVAERLAIDPSRASRVVSEMVDLGYARRAVSQADARRSIVELTAAGLSIVAAVRAYKFLIMGDFLATWTDAELAAFEPLLQKFGQWSDNSGPAADKYAGDIEAIAQTIETPAKPRQPAAV